MAAGPLTMTLTGKVFIQFAGGELLEAGEITVPIVIGVVQPEPPLAASAIKLDQSGLPHSRACGVAYHDHGILCSSNCPTCGGENLTEKGFGD
jgi:hypothetical protein